MKILIVSWFFPPSNTMAAVRVGNFAKVLLDRGHDVRILTALDPPYPQSIALGIPEDRIARSRWFAVNDLPDILLSPFAGKAKRRTAAPAATEGGGPPAAPTAAKRNTLIKSLRSWASEQYEFLFDLPDRWIGWYPYAHRLGRTLLAGWRPDLVFASGPPFTSMLIGRRLAKSHRLPLVLEFRDRWSNDPYFEPPAYRHAIDRFLERRVVADAAALVTVSEPWAAAYRATYGKTTVVIYNGFDPQDLARDERDGAALPGPVTIRYTGAIYAERRDPTPLFEALAALGADDSRFRIEFIGTQPDLVWPLAERCGVRNCVTVLPAVTHREAVALQRQADLLLLMQWNNPKEQGNVPGKFFEYLGALRPMIVLGLAEGVPATLLRERQAGFFSNDPKALATRLAAWSEEKRRLGHIPDLPPSAREGFARHEQFERACDFLESLVPGSSAESGGLTAGAAIAKRGL